MADLVCELIQQDFSKETSLIKELVLLIGADANTAKDIIFENYDHMLPIELMGTQREEKEKYLIILAKCHTEFLI